MKGKRQVLGVMGGTFDPIHYGHLRLAEEARQALELEKVRIVPAGRPPHRDEPCSGAEDRLAMAQLAVGNLPQFELDDSEVRADLPSYTVPTLERLRADLGEERPLVLLLGVDAFLGLPAWYRWRELFNLAHIAVATRPGYALHEQHMGEELRAEFHHRIRPRADRLAYSPAGVVASFAMTPLAISATSIRAILARGGSPRFLLPDAVLDYIQQHHLYGN
jgi:nicotinate-nucleotide adenylyltransferase